VGNGDSERGGVWPMRLRGVSVSRRGFGREKMWYEWPDCIAACLPCRLLSLPCIYESYTTGPMVVLTCEQSIDF